MVDVAPMPTTSALDAWEDPTVQAAFEKGEAINIGEDGQPIVPGSGEGEDGGKKKATVRRKARRITTELLCSENGLEKLAKISRDKNSFKRTRNLAVDIRHLVGLYESWARQLLPTVPFPDFVMQLERLSSNGKVQMKQMQIEQGHDDWAADEDIDNVDANASTAQDDWGDAGGGGVDEFGVDLDHEQAMAAAAEVAAAPKPASTLSSDLQAKIAANRAKALERRRAKASVAAAAAPNDTQTGVHDDMPSPEEEAEMMAAAATSKPAEEKQVLPTSSSSSFSPEDELDALMAEEEALGDLMDSEEFRDPERSQPFSTSTGAVEQQPQRGPDNDSEWEAIIEKDRRSVTSFEQAFK